MESQRVLVVDDSQPVRSLLALALRNRGYVVLEAGSGAAALRIAYEQPVTIAIVDQFMPGMTGSELIRLIRAAPLTRLQELPIIGLSGKPGSEKDLLGAGARVFLAKPFGEAELMAALDALSVPSRAAKDSAGA
jgi:CheY-like chemotaxis protein